MSVINCNDGEEERQALVNPQEGGFETRMRHSQLKASEPIPQQHRQLDTCQMPHYTRLPITVAGAVAPAVAPYVAPVIQSYLSEINSSFPLLFWFTGER